MAYILSVDRDRDVVAAFDRYRAYVADAAARFPAGAYGLATAAWYFDPRDPRCPHDAWLDALWIEPDRGGSGGEERGTSIRVQLLGAYRDGRIELSYSRVTRWSLEQVSARGQPADWRYDEFRLTTEGRVIHEVEWAGPPREPGARWIIEAADVTCRWMPLEPSAGR